MAALRKAAHHGRVISNLSQSRFYTVKVASSSPRAHDRPYLDGIEYPIIKSVSTRLLTFVSGQIDMIQPYTVTAPLLKDVKAQGPQAICELVLQNIRDLLINRGRPPFDNRDLRRVMALSLDRKAFIDILAEGQGDIGAAMLPPPEGRWSMPPEMVETLPGYGLDVQKNRAEARRIAEALGYRPDRRIAVKVSTRNIATAVNAAVVLLRTGAAQQTPPTNAEPQSACRSPGCNLRREKDIDLVITDQAMPRMTGIELIAAINAEWPALPTILATGYAELPPETDPLQPRLANAVPPT